MSKEMVLGSGEEAVRLIAAEYAVPVVVGEEIERAIAVAPAIEVRRRGRPRKAV